MAEKAPPVFLAVGDPFLTDQFYRETAASFPKSKSAQVEAQTFYLSETPLDEILGRARSLPFLAECQVFRIKDIEKQKDVESLDRYFDNPNSATLLFFESFQLAKDHPLHTLIVKKGQARVLNAENRGDIRGGGSFVKQKLKQAGKTAAPEVLSRLEELADASPSFLDSMLEKMIVYAGPSAEITEEILEKFQEQVEEETDPFQLTNALFSGRTGDAVILLKKQLAGDEKELIPLLGFLHWQVRRFWAARVLMDEGSPEAEILRKSKVYAKQAPYFMRQLKQLSRRKLEKAIEGLYEIDRKIKTGQADGALEAELWVQEFTGRQVGARV